MAHKKVQENHKVKEKKTAHKCQIYFATVQH